MDARNPAFRRFEKALLEWFRPEARTSTKEFRKAAKLLYVHLTPKQRDSICAYGFIRFKTKKANYEIGYGHGEYRRSYFVSERKDAFAGASLRNFCIAPVAAVSYPDLFLIHLWSLQADESGWRRTAVPV